VGLFGARGVERRPWASATPIREIFRRACAAAGLPYYNPHSLRQTLMRLAYDLNLGPRQLKAWSQNLGHESVLTSLGSYGALGAHEQADVMAELAHQTGLSVEDSDALLRQLALKVLAKTG
jgi:integrase